jgi:hypothetical protein
VAQIFAVSYLFVIEQNKLEDNHDKITTKTHLKRCEKAKIKGPKSLSLSNENNISHSFQFYFHVLIFLFYFSHLPLNFLPIFQKKKLKQ